MKNQTKEELKQIIRSVFFTGHDQGIHEVEKPDFDMFYRNCWEEKISEALDQVALTAREEAIGEICDKTKFDTRCESCDTNSSNIMKMLSDCKK